MQPAEDPNEKDDWNRNPDQPEQQTAAHLYLLFLQRRRNSSSIIRFRCKGRGALVDDTGLSAAGGSGWRASEQRVAAGR
jgi:hypothetical protein